MIFAIVAVPSREKQRKQRGVCCYFARRSGLAPGFLRHSRSCSLIIPGKNINWPEVALHFLRGVQADAAADGTEETAALLTRLLSLPDVPSLMEIVPPEEAQAPVLPIHFRRGEISLRLFTTIATLGTPREVTLEEVRIECFFPIDGDADAVCRSWEA